MVPPEFQPFFLASVGASAALIGLLFVSVSIAPERVFGQQSDAVRRAQALSAFTALVNVFFISMTSLIPSVQIGVVVVIIAFPSALQTLALLGLVRHWREGGILYRGLVLFLGSAFIYGFELAIGFQLWASPGNRGSLEGLLELLLGAYAVGLGRAWELLGAPRSGMITTLFNFLGTWLDRGRAKKP